MPTANPAQPVHITITITGTQAAAQDALNLLRQRGYAISYDHAELAVTDQHRRAAFQAMAWVGWTYEQAMADPVRSRLVNLRARQMCNAQAKAGRRVVVPSGPRARPTPRGRSFIGAALTDLKRAASGDRDED